MEPKLQNINRKRFETSGIVVNIVDADGNVVQITGYTGELMISSTEKPSADLLMTLAGTPLDADAGKMVFYPSDTEAAKAAGSYWFDMRVTDADGKIHYIMAGLYILSESNG